MTRNSVRAARAGRAGRPSMLRFILIVSLAALSGYLALPPSAALTGASAAPRKAALRPAADGARAFADVAFLASDEFRGRKAGSPEYRRAAEYVAAEMKKAGLEPGGENGTWFQEVPFKPWTDFEPPTRLEIVAPSHRVYFAGRARDFVPVNGTGSGRVRGRLAFAGYGVASANDGWDDYAGLEPKGRIVVVMPGLPDSLADTAKSAWTFARKVKTAAEKGAVGLIEMDLAAPGEPRQPGPPSGPRPQPGFLAPGAAPDGFVVLRAGRDFLDDAFYLAGGSWRDLVSKILRLKKPLPKGLEVEAEMEAHFVSGERTAPNVIGVLRGTDPKLKGEALVIGGHLDHLGVGIDGWIYPGADDNATSAATVLETARTLHAAGFKPARTIVFGAWAGEELGLQGSRYYTEHPFIPLDRTVLYMNIDMVGTGDSDLLVGGMTEFAELYGIAEKGLDAETIKRLKPRPNYRGSDHTSFWSKSVPAVSLRSGEALTGKLDDEHPEYHRPGDRPALIEPERLRQAAQYHVDILRYLASCRDNLLDPVHRTMFLHRDALVVDMHCDTIARAMAGEDLAKDLPKGHIDIPKLERGGVDLEVFACFAPPPGNETEKLQSARGVFAQIEAVHELVDKNPDKLALVLAPQDVNAVRNEKTGVLIGIEGGYAIENDLVLLREFFRAGVRLMTLTHWTATDWADASGDTKPVHGGLTGFGEKVVAEMNRLGMIVDVSHAGDETFWDVLRLSKAPVVASHSACRALSPHHRNLSDEMLKALAEKNGVIGITVLPEFLNSALAGMPETLKSRPRVDVGTVVDHIDHVVQVTGDCDHVGLGSDYDGTSDTPAGLENVGLLPSITGELVSRGYKPADIRKILGGNFLRVFQAVDKAKGQ